MEEFRRPANEYCRYSVGQGFGVNRSGSGGRSATARQPRLISGAAPKEECGGLVLNDRLAYYYSIQSPGHVYNATDKTFECPCIQLSALKPASYFVNG